MRCVKCGGKTLLQYEDGTGACCHDYENPYVRVSEKKKIGRPVTLEPDDRKKRRSESNKQWADNNKEHLRKYNRAYKARRRKRLEEAKKERNA